MQVGAVRGDDDASRDTHRRYRLHNKKCFVVNPQIANKLHIFYLLGLQVNNNSPPLDFSCSSFVPHSCLPLGVSPGANSVSSKSLEYALAKSNSPSSGDHQPFAWACSLSPTDILSIFVRIVSWLEMFLTPPGGQLR